MLIKRLLLTVLTLIITCAISIAQAQEPLRIDISRFHEIDAKGNVHILLLPNSDASYIIVELYGVNSKDFKYKVKNGVLYIDVPSGVLDKVGYVRMIAAGENIKAIHSLGASVECLRPIKGHSFEYKTRGAKNSAQLLVDVTNLTINTTGNSDATISGTSQRANYIATMNSRIDALNIECDNVTAKSNTSSEIYLASNGAIKAQASTWGSIYYIGSATIEPKMSLGGGITAIERAYFSPQFEQLWDEPGHTMFEQSTTNAPESEIEADTEIESIIEANTEIGTAIKTQTEVEPAPKSIPAKESRVEEQKVEEQSEETTDDGDFF